MKPALGFRTGGLRAFPLEAALRGISEAGFDCVELCEEHPGVRSSGLDMHVLSREVIRLLADVGLSASSVSYHGKADEAAQRRERGSRALQLATGIGCDVLVAGSPLRDRCDWRSFVAEMALLCGKCEEAGIVVACEPEPDTMVHDLECWRKLHRELGAGNLRLNLDLGHVLLTEESVPAAISCCCSHVAHVHLEGMARGRHRHLLPGEGDLDLREALETLGGCRYTGPIVVDLFDLPHDEPWPIVRSAHERCVSLMDWNGGT
jgi:sugar phosphate isomerase/epimerase